MRRYKLQLVGLLLVMEPQLWVILDWLQQILQKTTQELLLEVWTWTKMECMKLLLKVMTGELLSMK